MGSCHSSLTNNYCDGFEYAGSILYGNLKNEIVSQNSKIKRSYKVKLAHFTNKYDKALSFFKLHGSINNYIVYKNNKNKEIERIKIEPGMDLTIIEEQFDKSKNTFEFKRAAWTEISPDFISGTTNKMIQYESNSFYKLMVDHFKNNLKKSKILIVIGYGFRDPGINKIIEDCFLKCNKKMFVIDPGTPEFGFEENNNVKHIKKSFVTLSKAEYNSIVSQI